MHAYSWYLNDKLIEGAIKPFYQIDLSKSGNYNIETVFENGCKKKSDTYSYTTKSSNNKIVNIIPNPNNGVFTIEINNSFTGKVYYSISDYNGKKLKQGNINKVSEQISFEEHIRELKQGMYFINFIFNDKKISKVFIVN